MITINTAMLPERTLGKTGVRVPILGLGTAEGGIGLSNDDGIRLFRKAVESGVTYIDTAPAYDNAQVQLASALKDYRKDAFIATKVGTSAGREFAEGLEQNLSALETEYVDLAFIHSVGDQNIDELLSHDELSGLEKIGRAVAPEWGARYGDVE